MAGHMTAALPASRLRRSSRLGRHELSASHVGTRIRSTSSRPNEGLATQLHLERLDSACEGWLGDAAALGGFRQIQRLTDRWKIADLVHFHNVL